MLKIIENSGTDYVLSVPSYVYESNREDIVYLQRVLVEKYGVSPHVSSEGKHKIGFVREGDSLDYSISVNEETGDITVKAGSTEAMKAAILRFITQYCTNDGEILEISADDNVKYSYFTEKIDNGKYLSYRGGRKTALAPSDSSGELMTPDWLDSLVMVELRTDIASIGGGFRESYDLIDFYARTGVNGLWLAPIYKRGPEGNGYGNFGLQSLEPALTGTDDDGQGWQTVRDFIEYAHSKGIYIFLDIISWGTMNDAPLKSEHPDWFDGSAWGNAAFNWKNDEFKEWYISNAVANIEKTGADGYRCDCEPFTAGYGVFAEIRKRLSDKGIYIVIMSEEGGLRKNSFDLEQDGVLDYGSMTRGQLYENPVNFFTDGYLNIVDASRNGYGLGASDLQADPKKRGTYRYYSNCITNHDYVGRNVNGNRLKIGYAAVFAPYIPIWFMGDEFGAECEGKILYNEYVDYSVIMTDPQKAYFYEDVKRMLAIRRKYSDIFEYFPMSHNDTNICKVEADGLNGLQNYARYRNNRAIIVLANNDCESTGVCRVRVPYEECGISGYSDYAITDLLTGKVIYQGEYQYAEWFSTIVPYLRCGVYLVEGKK